MWQPIQPDMKRTIFLTIFFAAFLFAESFSCTIIMVRGNGVAIAGSNEDFFTPLTMMWYIPASEKYYARVCFGFNMMVNSTQGGMNEHGLFLDGNSLGKQGWKPDNNKQGFMGSVLDHLLATCADLEDVKDFFRNYNCPALDVARIPVMDKSGASMIVEWYNGEVVFLESEDDFQISTNFVGSRYIGKEKPCWRYNKAEELLSMESSFSVSTVRDALDATHVEGPGSITIYSFICDLKTGDISVYNFHDFTESRKFNFDEEIKKGHASYYLAELFPGRTSEYEKFILEAPLKMLQRGLRNGRFQANMLYLVFRKNYPEVFKMEIGPEVLNEFASGLNADGRIDDAIFFMEQNSTNFPGDASVHYELGKLYHKSESIEEAIAEYKRTLEIDPGHKGAGEALSRIQR